MNRRYNDLNSYLKGIFGCRVQKITVDAGLSCPNRDGTISSEGCIYCNARGSGTGAYAEGLSVTDQIIKGKTRLSKRYKAEKFIAYFQSFSNTYAPLKKLKILYEEALSVDDVVGLSIGTRCDCIDEPVLELLKSYGKDYLVWLEYGLQSAHNETLDFINRGHDFQSFKSGVDAARSRGISVCAHVILGLPYEKSDKMLKTARIVAKMGIDGIKLHVLYVIKGTKLEKLYNAGKYRCLEQQEYVDSVCDFLALIPQNMVIHRLTGDPHPREFVAPAWSLKKGETLALIRDALKRRNLWQGKFADV